MRASGRSSVWLLMAAAGAALLCCAGPALLILAPMLMPIAARYGLDPVYFGVVIIVNLCIGLITPPVGNILYVACGISKLSVAEMSRAIWPNIVIGIIVLFIVTYLPWTVTFIPSLLP